MRLIFHFLLIGLTHAHRDVKLSRDFEFPFLFLNELYVSQNEPFKLHCLCANSHTNIAPSIALFGHRKTLRNRYWTL